MYLDYLEVCPLADMTAGTLIKALNPVFATHGVPMTLISDSGPNYSSRELAKFAQDRDFEHHTTSPHHSQSNGKAATAVKVAKSGIKKPRKDDKDIYQAILEWRNSPAPGSGTSPVQRLMPRRTRSFLPCKSALYHPRVVEDIMKALVERRRASTMNFDGSAKPLPTLVVGQPVRTKTRPKNNDSPWVPGRIAARLTPRSYLVQVGDRRYGRNKIHLHDSHTNQLKAMPQPQWSSLSMSMNSLNPTPSSTDKDISLYKTLRIPPVQPQSQIIRSPGRAEFQSLPKRLIDSV